MKGIVIAGGSGTRLHPATLAVSKQLLPVYDKPMIYYPISMLMLAAIRDILIISPPETLLAHQRLLGTGEQFGLRFAYAVQPRPEGSAQAFVVGRDFVGADSVALVVGDNLFFGAGLKDLLARAATRTGGATILAHQVDHPEAYSTVTLDGRGRPTKLVEKPDRPESRWAVTGLSFYDNRVLDLAAAIESAPTQGRLSITRLNQAYLDCGDLHVEPLSRGYAWFDTRTHDSLLEACAFVRTLQQRQGLQIACLEEIAYQEGFITRDQLVARGELFAKTPYGQNLLRLARDEPPAEPCHLATNAAGRLQPPDRAEPHLSVHAA